VRVLWTAQGLGVEDVRVGFGGWFGGLGGGWRLFVVVARWRLGRHGACVVVVVVVT
jgi:mRNA-degrading endonuclease toxin of MazEF toxin-antitoxin module